MKVQCSWCGKVIGYKCPRCRFIHPPDKPVTYCEECAEVIDPEAMITHGICPECKKELKDEGLNDVTSDRAPKTKRNSVKSSANPGRNIRPPLQNLFRTLPPRQEGTARVRTGGDGIPVPHPMRTVALQRIGRDYLKTCMDGLQDLL